ncbi:MAG: nicotinamide-nucleotide adenylyltransferase [Thermoplasmata archaeon]
MRGLFLGRFQPFHLGHLHVVQELKRQRPEEELLIGVGSAQISHTPDNPFTGGERMEMVLRALRESRIEGVVAIPLLDIDRHGMWVAYLASILPAFGRVYTSNPLTEMLFRDSGYEVLSIDWYDRDRLEGTRIRRGMVDGGEWRSRVPPAVAGYLEEIGAPDRLRRLAVAPRPPEAPPLP